MRRIMQHLVSRTWPDMVIDYYNLQRLIPLKKPSGHGIRPVCIPTAWRKVAYGTLAYATAIQRHLFHCTVCAFNLI